MPADRDHDSERRLIGPRDKLGEGREAGLKPRHDVAEAGQLVAGDEVYRPDERPMRAAALHQRRDGLPQFP